MSQLMADLIQAPGIVELAVRPERRYASGVLVEVVTGTFSARLTAEDTTGEQLRAALLQLTGAGRHPWAAGAPGVRRLVRAATGVRLRSLRSYGAGATVIGLPERPTGVWQHTILERSTPRTRRLAVVEQRAESAFWWRSELGWAVDGRALAAASFTHPGDVAPLLVAQVGGRIHPTITTQNGPARVIRSSIPVDELTDRARSLLRADDGLTFLNVTIDDIEQLFTLDVRPQTDFDAPPSRSVAGRHVFSDHAPVLRAAGAADIVTHTAIALADLFGEAALWAPLPNGVVLQVPASEAAESDAVTAAEGALAGLGITGASVRAQLHGPQLT